jgi:F-type H+-transporting ATPase subunit a
MKNFNLLIKTLFSIAISAIFYNASYAQDGEPKEKDDFVMHHIKDAHDWHIATINHKDIVLELPIILFSLDEGIKFFSSKNFKDENHNHVPYMGFYLNSHDKIVSVNKSHNFYDVSITKNVAAMLIGVILLLIVFISAAKKYRSTGIRSPRGFWNLLESLIIFVRDEIVIPNIGVQKYKKYMPYMLTIFFFIWITNLLGLLPCAANVTGNISVALVLAGFTFIITTLNSTKSYWGHIFKTPGVPLWLSPIMIPVEILGLFTKPISLMIRLFANITAGHIILLSIINLIFILGTSYIGLISVPFGAFMFILKLLVSFLQAYIFTLLSAIYIGAATADDDH